jgi:branched-chain amino acid transport system substrate-binding protein
MADRVTATARTRSAIRAANDGELNDARTLLAEALEADREYAPAWLWFAAITEDEGEQRFCLKEAQSIAPDRSNEMALNRLRLVRPTPPPELSSFVDPEPPKMVRTYREDVAAHRRRRRIVSWLSVAAVLAVGLAIFSYANSDRRTPYYIAVVTGVPGQDPNTTPEMQAAAQWAIDKFNNSDRLPGIRLEEVIYNDQGDPARAKEIAEEIVADDRFIAVVGHQTSAASEAAGPVYAAGGIPAITPSATADALTEGNPWYFRSIFDNTIEGRGLADYGIALLGGGDTVIIYSESSFGRTLAEGIESTWTSQGEVLASTGIESQPDGSPVPEQVRAAVDALAAANHDGLVYLATSGQAGVDVVKEMRLRGLNNTIIGGDTISSLAFYEALVAEPNPIPVEQVNGIFAGAPLVVQALTGEAVTFYDQFSEQQGYVASWRAGMAHDAVDLIAGAMQRSRDDMSGSLADQRGVVRDTLADATTPATAIQALTRPIFFDDNGTAIRPVAVSIAEVEDGETIVVDAGFRQLVEYSPQAGLTLEKALEEGIAVQVQDRVFTVQRIVNVGMAFNQVSNLDTGADTFDANFFVYLKFPGEDDAADIYFPNAVDPDLSPGDPVRKKTIGDGLETYVLYEVSGTFKGDFDFIDFPFDSQDLTVSIGNKTLPSARIIYSPDPELLLIPQSQRLISGVDSEATINDISNWQANSVTFFPRSVGSNAGLGDPEVTAGPAGVTYSQFIADVNISRDVQAFLVKNVLPLALLLIVTFIALWLPIAEAGRVTLFVTGILTGAVMLNSVTNSLVNVDYTVAIEWAYYAFIGLSAIMLLLTLVGRYFNEERRLSSLRKLTSFTKIFFLVYVFFTVMAYVLAFG